MFVLYIYSLCFYSLDSSLSHIKKRYHELSLIYHPDMKTGDSEIFMAISKAYKTLTNPEMLRTFYETGDPNGKKSVEFSIALPTWLSNEDYSTLILLIYGCTFLILLPTTVGIWWHRSMKFNNTKVNAILWFRYILFLIYGEIVYHWINWLLRTFIQQSNIYIFYESRLFISQNDMSIIKFVCQICGCSKGNKAIEYASNSLLTTLDTQSKTRQGFN